MSVLGVYLVEVREEKEDETTRYGTEGDDVRSTRELPPPAGAAGAAEAVVDDTDSFCSNETAGKLTPDPILGVKE
jgi:hypothetical protein